MIKLLAAIFILTTSFQTQALDKAPYDEVVKQVEAMWKLNDINQVKLATDYKLGSYDIYLAGQIIPQIIDQHPKLEHLQLTRIDANEDSSTLQVNYHFEHQTQENSEIIINADLEILQMTVFDDILSQSEVTGQKGEAAPQDSDLAEKPFLSQAQKHDLYGMLVDEIEANDAEAIETRNQTKTSNWQQYVNVKRPAFINAKNWIELAAAFNSFGAGFVNLHSKFKFNSAYKSVLKQANIELGFTYPEVSFFTDDDQQQDIASLNDEHIKDVFSDYEDLHCDFSSTIGCLQSFTTDFKRGKIVVNAQTVNAITTASGNSLSISYQAPDETPNNNSYYEAIDTSESDNNEWQLLGQGYKVALFKQRNNLLLKIKDFVFKGGSGVGFRCQDTAIKESICHDVQLIRSVLDKYQSTQTNLIIDVQNNGGGNENTALLAELMHAPFEDLQVAFKNTEHLKNDQLRSYLFYGSPKAEAWYENLNTKDFEGDFLPMRADFCQGDDKCAIKTIQPNSERTFKDTYIITNHNCVSSCDDFVWRMSEFGGAKVVGLPHATDATYSRIAIMFYLDDAGQIKKTYFGDGMKAEFSGTELFNITIPYSKTIQNNGAIRAGKTAEYEFIIPVTKKNFNIHAKYSAKLMMAR